jgi:pimeloyl-ACP methyl ester carboxylesterase
MINDTVLAERGAKLVRANDIDIAYVEAGDGPPLVLLHGGFVSTGPAWADSPVAYVRHMATLAKHFRVIAPDTRGSGATVHPGGTASYSLLADDVVALIDALHLERPLLAGFSDGAAIATVVAIRQPDTIGALAAHAGYDIFVPDAPIFAIGRALFGGSPRPPRATRTRRTKRSRRCPRWRRCSRR